MKEQGNINTNPDSLYKALVNAVNNRNLANMHTLMVRCQDYFKGLDRVPEKHQYYISLARQLIKKDIEAV